MSSRAPAETPESDRVGAGLPRGVEVVLSGALLAVAAPVLAVAAAAIALTSRGPVLFRQTRVGRGGRPLTLIKLRTMRAASGGPSVTSKDDPRITGVGRLLRKTKIDELPELWNVLRGDLALVGPRPEVPEYVDLQDPAWRSVLRVRPGLTDPVTIRLRNEEELMASVPGDRVRYYREILQPLKLRAYADYLERRSWRSDLRVLLETGLAVLWPPLAHRLQSGLDLPESGRP